MLKNILESLEQLEKAQALSVLISEEITDAPSFFALIGATVESFCETHGLDYEEFMNNLIRSHHALNEREQNVN